MAPAGMQRHSATPPSSLHPTAKIHISPPAASASWRTSSSSASVSVANRLIATTTGTPKALQVGSKGGAGRGGRDLSKHVPSDGGSRGAVVLPCPPLVVKQRMTPATAPSPRVGDVARQVAASRSQQHQVLCRAGQVVVGKEVGVGGVVWRAAGDGAVQKRRSSSSPCSPVECPLRPACPPWRSTLPSPAPSTRTHPYTPLLYKSRHARTALIGVVKGLAGHHWGPAAVHLQRTHRGHNDHAIGGQAAAGGWVGYHSGSVWGGWGGGEGMR